MIQRESQDAERMEELILAAVEEIFREQDLHQFLDWARVAIPKFLDLDENELTADEINRLGALLGTAIWNATPLPALGYRPRPVPTPSPEQPCLCGSDRPFGQCCAQAGELPEMPADLVWELLLDKLDDDALQNAINHAAIPDHLLARVAERWLDDDRPGRAAHLLEPLFDRDLSQLDGRYETALDALCDAYETLDYRKKRQSFLRRVTETAGRELKAAAWQRISTTQIEDGQFAKAHLSFEQALRNAPDSPANALLEITLLATEHRDDLARERARFWRGKLRRNGQASERTLDFLTHAISDPQDALATTHADAMDPLLLRVRDWVEQHHRHSLPTYHFERAQGTTNVFFDEQLPLFAEQDLPFPAGTAPNAASASLTPPAALKRTERAWHRSFPASKPLGTQLSSLDDGDAWESGGWLNFLDHHPEAIDSLDILDDLATAIEEHPESRLPWIRPRLLRPLLERAQAIFERGVETHGWHRLPWSMPCNRPLLRLLLRLSQQRAEEGPPEAAGALLEQLLNLNPDDEYGIRAELMNHYLRYHEDEKAVALARRFPTDVTAELAYGEVLALYRLGQTERAAAILHDAFGRLPRVPRYLMRKRVRRPTLATSSVAPGSDNQAWLYREAMRDVWVSEPGLLAWMNKQTA
jgi:tetratricopeptide (TPR) repeat protein